MLRAGSGLIVAITALAACTPLRQGDAGLEDGGPDDAGRADAGPADAGPDLTPRSWYCCSDINQDLCSLDAGAYPYAPGAFSTVVEGPSNGPGVVSVGWSQRLTTCCWYGGFLLLTGLDGGGGNDFSFKDPLVFAAHYSKFGSMLGSLTPPDAGCPATVRRIDTALYEFEAGPILLRAFGGDLDTPDFAWYPDAGEEVWRCVGRVLLQ